MDDTVDFAVHAVLPAGGCGQRMELSTPKQFCLIHGRPLISYTLQAFEKVRWIQNIIVVISADQMDYMRQLLADWGHSLSRVSLAVAGSSRHRSIKNGVKAISTACPADGVIIIHDAVRPFVEENILKSVAISAQNFGAAGAVKKLVSTVIASDEKGFLDHSLERSKYRASEMPQAFQCQVIENAYDKCSDYDLDYGTECLHLALKYSNCRAKLVEGPDNLWKVTHKKDLYTVEGVVGEQNADVAVLGCEDQSVILSLTSHFKQRNIKFQFCSLNSDDADDDDGMKGSLGNAVIFHQESSAEKIIEFHNTHSSRINSMRTLIHIFKVKDNSDFNDTVIIRQKLKDPCVTVHQHLCSCVIVIQSGFDLDDLGELVSSLLLCSHPFFKSQVFAL